MWLKNTFITAAYASRDRFSQGSCGMVKNTVKPYLVTLSGRFNGILEKTLFLPRAHRSGVSRYFPVLRPNELCGKLAVLSWEPDVKNSILTALLVIVPLFAVTAGKAVADVLDADAGGFTSANETIIDASRQDVWRAAVLEVHQWWSSNHTISGEASRLHIDPRPQGCFCELLGEGAGVVHMTVTMLNPTVVLRLTGALGPLGLMGVDGNMTWEFSDADDGTLVKFTYAVGGYRPGGLDGLAGPVDGVLGEALLLLKAYAESSSKEQSDLE